MEGECCKLSSSPPYFLWFYQYFYIIISYNPIVISTAIDDDYFIISGIGDRYFGEKILVIREPVCHAIRQPIRYLVCYVSEHTNLHYSLHYVLAYMFNSFVWRRLNMSYFHHYHLLQFSDIFWSSIENMVLQCSSQKKSRGGFSRSFLVTISRWISVDY